MPQESMSIAVRELSSCPTCSDEELIQKLVGAGIERDRAIRLVLFVPSVYARLILASLGIQFSDEFRRSFGNGRFSENLALTSEPVWLEASDFAKANIGALSPRERLSIAGRSPEFGVINQALNEGAKASNMVLSPLVVWWSEEDPR